MYMREVSSILNENKKKKISGDLWLYFFMLNEIMHSLQIINE